MIRRAVLLSPLAVTVIVACGSQAGSAAEDIGEARAEITQVPADVLCVQISIVGQSSTSTRQFDVTPGQSSVLDMKGLPIGADTFKGAAFGSACSGVTGSSIPAWIGNDVQATLSPGVVTNVKLVLRHNGEANVSVDFQGDDAGATCPAGRTACGGQCVDTSTDPNNCGACGNVCTLPNACSGGVCSCTDDGTACANQVCGSAVNNCGKTVSCGVCNGRCCLDSCVCSTCQCP